MSQVRVVRRLTHKQLYLISLEVAPFAPGCGTRFSCGVRAGLGTMILEVSSNPVIL